jgi:DNA-binding transcriptional LysR family regulator
MKSEDVAAFTAVVRYKSLSRAAEALRLSQSVVTRRVQSFEDSLGVQLLDRNTKPLRPSQLGLRVYEQSRSVLHQLEVLKEMVATAAKPSGTMRIGTPQFISESILIELVQRLKTKYPELCIEVTSDLSPTLLEGVEEGDLDAALVLGPYLPTVSSRVVGKELASFEMEVVAAKGSLSQRPHTLRDVCDRGWILNPGACGFRSALGKLLVAKGLPLKVNLDVFGTEIQLGLVANGMGVGLVPGRLFTKSLRHASVQRLKLTDFSMRHKLWLARPAIQGSLTSAVMEFGNLVRRCFERSYQFDSSPPR